MELVAELWEKDLKVEEHMQLSEKSSFFFFFSFLLIGFCQQAEFVPTTDPSLTEQYEYANEHDIKCLVIITDQTDSVKVMRIVL